MFEWTQRQPSEGPPAGHTGPVCDLSPARGGGVGPSPKEAVARPLEAIQGCAGEGAGGAFEGHHWEDRILGRMAGVAPSASPGTAAQCSPPGTQTL